MTLGEGPSQNGCGAGGRSRAATTTCTRNRAAASSVPSFRTRCGMRVILPQCAGCRSGLRQPPEPRKLLGRKGWASGPTNAGGTRSAGESMAAVHQQGQATDWVRIHPLVVRITHWINVLAVLMMVTSGWRIYNASPLFDFTFPDGLTLGGWLAGALQWHFAAMWLLALNGLVYVVYVIASGHFRRTLLPISPRAVLGDVREALRGKLAHDDLAVYNAAQRAAYLALIVALAVLVLSGLAIWKPVQLQELAALMGGYEGARLVHFFAMAIMVAIVVVHVVMVILVPRTFPTMITGRARRAP